MNADKDWDISHTTELAIQFTNKVMFITVVPSLDLPIRWRLRKLSSLYLQFTERFNFSVLVLLRSAVTGIL